MKVLEEKHFNPSKYTPFESDNGKQIMLGDKLELTYNEGNYHEHKCTVTVIWHKGMYKLDFGNCKSILGLLGENVKVIK